MKLTSNQLKQIIKEEINKVLETQGRESTNLDYVWRQSGGSTMVGDPPQVDLEREKNRKWQKLKSGDTDIPAKSEVYLFNDEYGTGEWIVSYVDEGYQMKKRYDNYEDAKAAYDSFFDEKAGAPPFDEN